MRERKTPYIKCPVCGREYHPAEIYLPNSFFGRPKDIIRDSYSGKIDYFIGKDMDLVERYVCDKCNTLFKVIAKVQFNTFEDKKYNLDEDYKISVKSKQLFLNEE